MDRILYIQFRDDVSVEHDKKCVLSVLGEYADILDIHNVFLSDPVEKPQVYLQKYKCAILGGSAQYYLSNPDPKLTQALKANENLFYYLLEHDFPTFGICFGHQYIARLLGGVVEANKNMAESGSFIVKKTNSAGTSDLFKNLPDEFYAQMGHKDSVTSLPKLCAVTLETDKCLFAGFKYKNNIYTVQFHPELNPSSIVERIRLYPEYADGKSEEELKMDLREGPESTKLLMDFVKHYL